MAGAEDACAQALRQGLECLSQQGGTRMLRQFNRPAILALQDESGALHQVVLTRLDAATAVRAARQRCRTKSPSPTSSATGMAISCCCGSRGNSIPAACRWGCAASRCGELRQRLRQWAGLSPDGGSSDFFDASLESLVQQFQRQNGLAVDGIAGSQTQALLDAALAQSGTPLLAAGNAGA